MSRNRSREARLGVPKDTARVARAAFPKGNPYLRLRDALGEVYQEEHFACLFAHRGRPAESPGLLALVSVLQFAEGLSDRQAADSVRSRIDWKYLLGLELTDAGFDYSLLSDFRSRLLEGGLEQALVDLLLDQFKVCGLVKAGGRQRTDSTHVLAAIRVLNRLECVGETIRATLNALSGVAPDWVSAQVPSAWYERYSPRFEAYRFPKSEAQRQALALTIGADGHLLLSWIYAGDPPRQVRLHPAVEVLRQVWIQQYSLQEGQMSFRQPGDLPPGERLIVSPYDPQARMSQKRQTQWVGYKVHMTETCDADQPHLITHVETTPATVPDIRKTRTIQEKLSQKDLLPGQHLLDSGYVDARTLLTCQEQGTTLIGPVRVGLRLGFIYDRLGTPSGHMSSGQTQSGVV